MNEEFEEFWETISQTIGGKAAKAAWDAQADRIEALEAADRLRKELNAQMLMNATASGNRNYLAEVENLTSRVSRYKPYYEAVDKACILSNLGTARSFPSAEEAVNALCSWSQDAGAFFAEADRLKRENEELKCLTDTLQDELEANDIFPE